MHNNSNAEQTNGNKYMQNFTPFRGLMPENDPFFSGFHEFAPPNKKYFFSRNWAQAWHTLWSGVGVGVGMGGGGWVDEGRYKDIWNKEIFLLQNGALWDMVLVHCGICELGHLCRHWRQHKLSLTSSNGNISALLAFCGGKPPVTGGFPSQRPATRSFDIFFDLRLNKRVSNQSRRRWFETPSRSLWRHRNVKYTWKLCCDW